VPEELHPAEKYLVALALLGLSSRHGPPTTLAVEVIARKLDVTAELAAAARSWLVHAGMRPEGIGIPPS